MEEGGRRAKRRGKKERKIKVKVSKISKYISEKNDRWTRDV